VTTTSSPPGSTPGRRNLLRTYAWLIVAAMLATLAVAALFVVTSPVTWTATSEVVVGPEPTHGTPLQPVMGDEQALAQSGDVANAAASSLGESARRAAAPLSVSVKLESNVLRIGYTADNEKDALAGANAFTNAYVSYRNSSEPERVARVITHPEATVSSSGPDLVLVVGLAVLAGLALGVGAAWTWDRVSDRLRSPAELEERTGLPVLGGIPRWDHDAGPLAPPGPALEAFGYVAAGLGALTSGPGRGATATLLVTSPRAGAGCTTVAVNTARALALQGNEVVLVGADLQDPRLHECLSLAPAPGLLDVLHGDCTPGRAVQRTTTPNLRVLTAGSGARPDLHLPVDQLMLVLAQLGPESVVIVDACPLLSSADTLVLAHKADFVLLVADLHAGTRKDAVAAASLVREPVPMGWVVNHPRRARHATRPGSAAPMADVAEQPGVQPARARP